MSDPVLQFPPAPDERPLDSLSRRTAQGFVWLMTQTVGSKIAGMVGQVVLAWILMPKDIGLWGSASIVLAFTELIQRAGLRETLIHRHRTYHLWANSAFWMSAGLGLLGLVATAAMAMPAAWMLHDRRLIGMLLVAAAAMPLWSLDQIAEARLQIQLRFGLIASVNWTVTLLVQVLQVLFAWLLPDPYKPYAFVLPRPIVALVRLAILWPAASPPVRRSFDFRRWKYLVTDSTTVFLSQIAWQLQMQADFFVLGNLFRDKSVLGVYFLAWNLSIQTMQLFTGNLTGVLFPALSQLQQDRTRQIRTFLDATRGLALIAVPLCFLQMALADPGVRLFFQDAKWQDAIPVLQVLSIGMAMRVVASPGGSLIQAQGRFRTLLVVNWANALFFVALVTIGAKLGQVGHPNLWLRPATTVALAASVYFAIICPVYLYVAIRASGGTWRDVWHVYAAPFACSLMATVPAMLLGTLVPVDKIRGHRWAHASRVIVILAWSVAIYVPLVKQIAPQAWSDLIRRLARFFKAPASTAEQVSAASSVSES